MSDTTTTIDKDFFIKQYRKRLAAIPMDMYAEHYPKNFYFCVGKDAMVQTLASPIPITSKYVVFVDSVIVLTGSGNSQDYIDNAVYDYSVYGSENFKSLEGNGEVWVCINNTYQETYIMYGIGFEFLKDANEYAATNSTKYLSVFDLELGDTLNFVTGLGFLTKKDHAKIQKPRTVGERMAELKKAKEEATNPPSYGDLVKKLKEVNKENKEMKQLLITLGFRISEYNRELGRYQGLTTVKSSFDRLVRMVNEALNLEID
jgi:hypothetical protein